MRRKARKQLSPDEEAELSSHINRRLETFSVKQLAGMFDVVEGVVRRRWKRLQRLRFRA